MRKALIMITFYQITLASARRSSTYGRGMRAAFSSPSLSSWGICASTKSSSRLYNNNNYRNKVSNYIFEQRQFLSSIPFFLTKIQMVESSELNSS